MVNFSSFFSVTILAALLGGQPLLAQDVREARPDPSRFSQEEKDFALRDPMVYTISTASVRVTLLEVIEEPDYNYVRLQEQPAKDLDSVLVSVEKIVNIASKIWKIVADNQPVVNINTKYATAYPEGVTSASQLSGWSKPKSYVYGFYAENMYGFKMIDCTYKFSFAYNGTFKGSGKYLTAVAVIPTQVEVGWGYRFDINAEVPDSTVVNVGTHEAPLAALQMKLTWKMSTILKSSTGTSVYYVQGDGYFNEIASPWRKAEKTAGDLPSASVLLGPVAFN